MCSTQCSASKLGFDYDYPNQFGMPQSGKKSLLFVVYKWVFAIFFIAVIIYDLIVYDTDKNPLWKWFIFLTHIGFIIFSLTLLLQACVALHVHLLPDPTSITLDTKRNMPFMYKVLWLLQNINLSLSILITVLFWVVEYDEDFELTFPGIVFHAVNAAFVIFDFFISAFPVQVLHFYNPPLIGVAYGIFVLTYWSQDGTNESGKPYIYSVLNFDESLSEGIAWVVALTVLVGVLHLVWFGLYKLRVLMWASCGLPAKNVLPTNVELQNRS